MKNLFLVVIVFFIACSSLPISSLKGGVETTSFGQGSNKEEALNDAFRNAVEYVSGVIVYDETKVHNSQLLYDKILVYSKGYIKKYNIIFERSNSGITEVAVKSVVSPELLAHNMVELNVVSKEDIEKDLTKLDFAQHKIIDNFQLMEKFIGNPSDFFDRAYEMKLAGYKVTGVGKKGASGYWIVKISLKSQFWDTWLDLLKNAEMEYHSGAMPQGLYYGCSKDKYPSYTVPEGFGFLPVVEFSYPAACYKYGSSEGIKVTLDRNMLECNGCNPCDVNWTDSGCGGRGSLAGSIPEFVVFGSSAVIKVPFSGEDKESLGDTLKGGYVPLSYTVKEANYSHSSPILEREKRLKVIIK